MRRSAWSLGVAVANRDRRGAGERVPGGGGYGCGTVSTPLLDGPGNDLADTQDSTPNNGITVPESITKTIAPGVYYVEVSGFLDKYSLPSIPYQLAVDPERSTYPSGEAWP